MREFSLLLVVALLTPLGAADRIVLRDLMVIREAEVTAVDADGLRLSTERPTGTTIVTWDEVESIRLTDKKLQAVAVRLLEELGDPLYRLRVRLEIGDYAALLSPAESLLPTYINRRSQTAYLVMQSLVWGRLAAGRREEAVEPWLLAYELLRSRSAKLSDLPGARRPRIDGPTALLAELEPVWFDEKAALAAHAKGLIALETLADPVPAGARLYVASLAIAAGAEEDAALRDTWPAGSEAERLRQILLCQIELHAKKHSTAVDRLQKAINWEKPADSKNAIDLAPLAWYWLGRAQLASDNAASQRTGLLSLLRIPALHGRDWPELAAAALHEVANASEQDSAVVARLHAEIRQQYPATWHGRNLREASSTSPR